MNTVLVVDDEPNYRLILSELLIEEGYEVFIADSGEKALKIIEDTDLDLVLTDMRMEGLDGMELLRRVKDENSDLPVIMITAFGEVDKAVAAMQAGAFNYLTKPFNNEELLVNIKKAVKHYSLLKENYRLRDEVQSRYRFANMIGKNKKMQQLYRLIEKIAPTPASVLITGESGTGKELVARAIHFNSPRKQSPLISLNCAGLPEQLLESELFGHEKGAFTGATSLRKGRFELADTGTFFLDEVGEMPLTLQAKLLRVLQEKTFERVGGHQTLKVDVRIVAATNRDLREEVGKGNFREDLFYRLNVLHLHLPPLRERSDDIPLLVDHFVAKYAKQLNNPYLQITPRALRYLSGLPWIGNIRELENTIERAAILCSDESIDLEDVRTEEAGTGTVKLETEGSIEHLISGMGGRLPDILDTIEKKMVETALNEANHIQAHAADNLGITKSLLQYKMRKYNIQKK
ncbi:MAG: sigma-54 dependent transcriptional regulator [Proteobacteria bacterium]|nr:sigma-54 dependent transcriptional regulator [Pseudomonadota bacterium]MBU1715221.1 sigma-54 dependent transcriptional regulator [Pseudomonadota bacterium]